jgi:hypothetical protein
MNGKSAQSVISAREKIPIKIGETCESVGDLLDDKSIQ